MYLDPSTGDATSGDPPGGGSRRDSVDDVYARLRPAMLRLAHLLTGSLDLAEDVVQDAFVACSRHWDAVDVPDAYVRRAVTNQASSALRRLGRDRDKADRFGRRATVTLDIPELDETWAVLRCLPDRQRIAIVLRFYDDRSDAEIAEVLGCRTSTVRSSIHRGLARVRKEMGR